MASVGISTRLNRLERHHNNDFAEIRKLIKAGAFYDELTEKQKADYEKYKSSLGGAAEDIAGAKLSVMLFDVPQDEAYHFRISERKPAPTREELQERINEVEQYMLQRKYEDEQSDFSA